MDGGLHAFPVDGVAEALGPRSNRVPPIVFGGGLIGGLTGYFMQWFSAVVHYPINVGGRPLHSWPAFIPITFEMTVLGAALAAVVGMLALNGLPRPYHPVFNVPDFVRASSNRFFLSIQRAIPNSIGRPLIRCSNGSSPDASMRFLTELDMKTAHIHITFAEPPEGGVLSTAPPGRMAASAGRHRESCRLPERDV